VTCEWQVKLCDLSLIDATPEHFTGEYHNRYIIKYPTNVLFTTANSSSFSLTRLPFPSYYRMGQVP